MRKGCTTLREILIETSDGVLPSGNSVMAANLLRLSHLLEKAEWERRGEKMIRSMAELIARYPLGHGEWANNALLLVRPFIDLAICGEEAQFYRARLQTKYQPNLQYSGSDSENALPILSNRFKNGKTLMYICRDKVCEEPLEDPKLVLDHLTRK